MMLQSRKTFLRPGAIALLTLPLAACVTGTANRGVDSVHQPVVGYAAYSFDVQTGGGRLSPAEAARLDDWFASIKLAYGDRVAIVTGTDDYTPALGEDIANAVARHGLLLAQDSSAAAGAAPAGSVRLVVRRTTASVPGCPDWSRKQETDLGLAASSSFGCGVNGNLAAMVADPEDLVRGQSSESELRTATSNRAISTYRDKAPTGSGELKQMSAGGQ